MMLYLCKQDKITPNPKPKPSRTITLESRNRFFAKSTELWYLSQNFTLKVMTPKEKAKDYYIEKMLIYLMSSRSCSLCKTPNEVKITDYEKYKRLVRQIRWW